QPPIAIYAGIGVGVLLVLVVVVSLFSGGGEVTAPDTDPVAAADSTTPPAAASVGTIQLDVKPANARVTVNGVEYSGHTPRLISNLAPGTHKLMVVQDEGFLPFEQDVPISAGQQLTLPVKLQVKDVTLTVATKPTDATVKLIARADAPAPMGKGGQSFKLSRKPGLVYRVLVEAPGFEATEIPLTFSGEASDGVEVVLVKGKDAPDTAPAVVNKPKPTVSKPKPTPTEKPKPKAKTAELKIGSGPGLPP